MASYKHLPAREDSVEDDAAPSLGRSSSPTRYRPHAPGFWTTWRGTAIIGIATAGVASILNLAVLIWASVSLPRRDGFAVAFTGSGSRVATIDLVVKLFINVISTGVLISSCRCTQFIASPTRQDVNAAHRKGSYLDIGLRTWHNLRNTGGWRAYLIVVLFITSLPMHWLYNSAAIVTTVAQDYVALTVDDSFVTGTTFDASVMHLSNGTTRDDEMALAQSLQQKALNGTLRKVDAIICNNMYMSQFQSTFGNVLIVSNGLDATTGRTTSTVAAFRHGLASYAGSKDYKYNWQTDILSDAIRGTYNQNALYADALSCQIDLSISCETNSTVVGVAVDHCLVEDLPARTEYSLNIGCLTIVVALTAVKAIALMLAINRRFTPLITTGDAISSFLATPDDTTDGLGPISVIELSRINRIDSLSQPASAFLKRQYRWFQAPARFKWYTGTLCLWLPTLAGVGCLLFEIEGPGLTQGVTNTHLIPVQNLDGLLTASATANSFEQPPLVLIARSYVVTALVVNAFQIILSIGYIVVNDLVTSIYMVHEYQKFGDEYHKLRTTNGLGGESTRYFLSLPNRYAVFIVGSWIAFHWLLSTEVMLVRVDVYDYKAILNSAESYTAMLISSGYSLPIMIMPATLFVIIILFCIRKLGSQIPLARTSSLAISAACHRGPHEDAHVVLMPLKYGVLPGVVQDDLKCVGFSSLPVTPLVSGETYTSWKCEKRESMQYGVDV